MAVTRTACIILTCQDDTGASDTAVECRVTLTDPPRPGERSIVGEVATKLILLLTRGKDFPRWPAHTPPPEVIQ